MPNIRTVSGCPPSSGPSVSTSFTSRLSVHVEHYAADHMYIDFAGDRLEVVDEMTGETKKAEVFVAILPFSHYTYCEAVWSQRKEDLIKACENAMQYF